MVPGMKKSLRTRRALEIACETVCKPGTDFVQEIAVWEPERFP
jgi:hypothetical protein